MAAVGGQLDWPSLAGDTVAQAGQWVTSNGLVITALLSTADPNAERWTVISSIPSRTVDVEAQQHRERWTDWMQWANVLQFLRGYGRNAVIAATTQADTIELDHLWLLDGAASTPTSEAVASSQRAVSGTHRRAGRRTRVDRRRRGPNAGPQCAGTRGARHGRRIRSRWSPGRSDVARPARRDLTRRSR